MSPAVYYVRLSTSCRTKNTQNITQITGTCQEYISEDGYQPAVYDPVILARGSDEAALGLAVLKPRNYSICILVRREDRIEVLDDFSVAGDQRQTLDEAHPGNFKSR